MLILNSNIINWLFQNLYNRSDNMDKLITFKGNNKSLQLLVDKNASFVQVHQALVDKLSASVNFFVKNTQIYWENPAFPKHQQQILTSLFKKYHLLLEIKATESVEKVSQDIVEELPDKFINRTIRGGEEICYKGSIVIVGNVNPGAKIVAGGNIDIHGSCRGVVHAGAFGNSNAFIVADKLAPLQIRIADYIARSPDNADEFVESNVTEKAMIKDGNIILEPFIR